MEETVEKSSFKNYLYFWSGQLVSILGSSVVYFVTVWWLVDETESAIALSQEVIFVGLMISKIAISLAVLELIIESALSRLIVSLMASPPMTTIEFRKLHCIMNSKMTYFM